MQTFVAIRVSRETPVPMKRAIEQLRAQASAWGIHVSSTQLSSLCVYADLLGKYELANVIGTRTPDNIIVEHLADSLSCLLIEDLNNGNSVVDVGTGGGLPGIPLAIARSGLHVTLLEAKERKVGFLKHALSVLGLQNLTLLHARAEEIGREPGYREAFDIATTRALAALPVVIEYCAPLVRPGGTILAMKARLPEEELSNGVAASQELGIALREVREVTYLTRFPQKERRLVVSDKVGVTPERFPRRVGMATKRPLGT